MCKLNATLIGLMSALMVVVFADRALGGQSSTGCTNCVAGICQDSPPEADNGTPYYAGA